VQWQHVNHVGPYARQPRADKRSAAANVGAVAGKHTAESAIQLSFGVDVCRRYASGPEMQSVLGAKYSFGGGVEMNHQTPRSDNDDSVSDRVERSGKVCWESAASLSCVRRACCSCGTSPLMSFTRSGVSNDSERRGDATTKHDVVVPEFSRTKRPSSNPLGRIQCLPLSHRGSPRHRGSPAPLMGSHGVGVDARYWAREILDRDHSRDPDSPTVRLL
jgi:hypothetical protein